MRIPSCPSLNHQRMRTLLVFILALGMAVVGTARADTPNYTLDNDPMRQGNKAFAAGNFDLAQQYFTEAVTNSYHLPEALLGLARIDLDRGADQNAENHARQALTAAGDRFAEARACLGIALWRQGRTGEAAQAFSVALEQDPKLWEAHYGMALTFIAAEQWDKAKAELAAGKKRRGLVEGEDLYQHGMALVLQGTGDMMGAEQAALKARNLAPQVPAYAYLVARIYQAEDIPALAIPALEEALALLGQKPAADMLCDLGRLYETQQRFNEARDRYLQAVAADSTYAPALADLADLFSRAKQHDRAASTYLRLVDLKPDNLTARLGLADALYQGGRMDQSLAAAQAAMALSPHNESARFYFVRAGIHAAADSTRAMAAALLPRLPQDLPWKATDLVDLAAWQTDRGDYTAADSNLDRAAAIDSSLAAVPFQRGLLELRRGQPQAAAAAFNRAVALEPDNAANHLDLGIARFQAGQIDSAIVDFRRAVELRSDLTMARLLLAQGLAMTGSLKEAEKEYRTVLAADPHNAKALRGIGFCSLRRADYQGAVKFYQAATVAEPDNADGWAGLGTSKLGLGKLDEAAKDFVKARAIDPENAMLKTGSDLLNQAKNNGKEN